MSLSEKESTVSRIRDYYHNSLSYLTGPLGGTCHFGFTPENQQFELSSALHFMEMLLGKKLALPPGSRVLDGGCGFGRVAKTLSSDPFNLEVVAVDLMKERLQEAKRYEEVNGVAKKVRLTNGNYCFLPFADETMDGVYIPLFLQFATSELDFSQLSMVS